LSAAIFSLPHFPITVSTIDRIASQPPRGQIGSDFEGEFKASFANNFSTISSRIKVEIAPPPPLLAVGLMPGSLLAVIKMPAQNLVVYVKCTVNFSLSPSHFLSLLFKQISSLDLKKKNRNFEIEKVFFSFFLLALFMFIFV
jgi:hypothetical protein